MWDGVLGGGRWSSNIPKSQFLKDRSFGFLKLYTGGRVMKVCDASTSISAKFGGIRDSCLDIYHLISRTGRVTTIMGNSWSFDVSNL